MAFALVKNIYRAGRALDEKTSRMSQPTDAQTLTDMFRQSTADNFRFYAAPMFMVVAAAYTAVAALTVAAVVLSPLTLTTAAIGLGAAGVTVASASACVYMAGASNSFAQGFKNTLKAAATLLKGKSADHTQDANPPVPAQPELSKSEQFANIQRMNVGFNTVRAGVIVPPQDQVRKTQPSKLKL